MELGALVCTPRAPKCPMCPVRAHCAGLAAGVQERIPAPRKAKPTPLLRRATFCIRRGDEWLIEQRPARGRWAGMWQFVTVERNGKAPSPRTVRKLTGVAVEIPRRIGTASHALTHRRYAFDIYVCAAHDACHPAQQDKPRRWVTREELDRFPLPRPQVKVAHMLDAL